MKSSSLSLQMILPNLMLIVRKSTENSGRLWEIGGFFLKREENKGDLVRKMDE